MHAFKFEGWPVVANEWRSRQRKWPSVDTVQNVLQSGCQIVAKRPLFPHLKGDPKNEDHSPEHDRLDPYFRLSFSRCEIVLSKSLNEYQLLIWRVLKAYQKSFLNTSPRVLASYHWKNVVFWVFEETDVTQWTEEVVLPIVCKALDKMVCFLREKFLPQYFIRACNLIDGCREDKIIEVLDRIHAIRENPLQYLIEFFINPPTADQHTVDSTTMDSVLKQDSSMQNNGDVSDRILENMMCLLGYIENGYLPRRLPTGLKNVLKITVDMFKESDGSNPLPEMFSLKILIVF